ncbi:putative GEM-like protein 8 isoform D [Glycine soja]|uniref:Putative GEM-like protein 8 isoform D n=1 Tax=Glycine soja TaxID=3848 RepID=A0A445J1S5_GLYSO|nr:putative GEM-like protein 8 isoform D [Glycine soja]
MMTIYYTKAFLLMPIHTPTQLLQKRKLPPRAQEKAEVLHIGFMTMGKLSLGARIIQEGGRGSIFKSVFGMQEKEQLLKASQCYLYTTAGPIAGILFVSTEKVAFYSERPITFSSATGELVRAPYKVLIPIGRIKEVNESQNVNKAEQKYIEIVTEDDSEFWFVGFLRYEKALKNLNKAISMANQF